MEEKQLGEQINLVVEARRKADEASHKLQSARAIWEVTNHALFEESELTKVQCEESEQLLRELTLQAYQETGNKTPLAGIGIRVMTRLSYEAKEAMDWALEHKLALKLDTGSFEKIAKTSSLPFVTVLEEPQATIATDLQGIEWS